MKNKDINSLILEYLEGGLDAGREKILKSMLIEHGYDIDELRELSKTWHGMEDIPIPQPGDRMTENFYRMLDNYKQQMRCMFTGKFGLSLGRSSAQGNCYPCDKALRRAGNIQCCDRIIGK